MSATLLTNMHYFLLQREWKVKVRNIVKELQIEKENGMNNERRVVHDTFVHVICKNMPASEVYFGELLMKWTSSEETQYYHEIYARIHQITDIAFLEKFCEVGHCII